MPLRALARPALALALALALLAACSPGPQSGTPDAGPPECGNGVVEDGEVCDGAALGGADCTTQGFVEGSLACRGDCGGFITTGCSACGDGVVQPLEACDRDNVPTTCEALGYVEGTMGCLADCSAVDPSGCEACGNGVIDPGEECDGDELGASTCETEGFGSGTLSCVRCALDTSGCDACGNGVLDPGEVCDGAALGDATCGGLGFAGGTPVCTADCSAVTPKGCVGLACDGCGTDCGACADGAGCDPATGACADWCRVTPTDPPLLLDHRTVAVTGQVHTRGAVLPEGWSVRFDLVDGPSDPVVVPVNGGGFEAALRTGVWEATVVRGEETWAASVRVPVAGEAAVALDLPRRVPVQVVARELVRTRTLHLEPLDPAARPASIELEPGTGPWSVDVLPGTYRVALERDLVLPGAEANLRVERSLSVVDAPALVEVDLVPVLARIDGAFLDDPWALLEFERVDDGLTSATWPVVLGQHIPVVLTPGTYRVRLVGTYSDDYAGTSGRVEAVIDPSFVVGREAAGTAEVEFRVNLHAEKFVADVSAGGTCAVHWQLEAPELGHVAEGSGPCSGVPIMLPSRGGWLATATPSLDFALHSAPVDLGAVNGGGRYDLPLHRVGVTVTLDGTPVPGEAVVQSTDFPSGGVLEVPQGSFETWLADGAYRISFRSAAPGAPYGWNVLEDRLEVSAAREVSLELGPTVELAIHATRDGVPLAAGELPRLSLLDDAGGGRPAYDGVALLPGHYRLTAAGNYVPGSPWPREMVMLPTDVELTAGAPHADLTLPLGVADLSGTVQVNGVPQQATLQFDQPRPPQSLPSNPARIGVDASGAFGKAVWVVPGVLLVNGQPLRCEQVSKLEP